MFTKGNEGGVNLVELKFKIDLVQLSTCQDDAVDRKPYHNMHPLKGTCQEKKIPDDDKM